MGVLAAWLGFPAMASFYYRPGQNWDLLGGLVLFGFILPFVAIFAGPGAFLLACLHARQMGNWAPRARSVGHIRRVGILLGMPLGVANLALVFGVFSFLNNGTILLRPELGPWLIPAVAGGAGLGWGVTFGLRPGTGRPKPTRIVRPTRPPALRRDGPPFFDNRPDRMIRGRSLHEVRR
jgi:hypothetical protein